jgi:uncharacterized membrane protein
MLVTIPIGLWLFSLGSDLIHLFGWGRAVWSDIAFYTIAAGIVGAFLAALPGLIDYHSLTEVRLKNLAAVHMVVNLTVVLLFTVNLWLRLYYEGGMSLPVIFSGVGIALLVVGGWLGGELVYIHGVAVEPQHDIARKAREKQKRKLRLV